VSDSDLQLDILLSDGTHRTLSLDQSKSVRFGTSKLVEVVVSGKDVRALHCGVIWKKDHFELAAATAAKLVEFNETQVASAVLRVGDRFRVGDVEATVVARDATVPPAKATNATGADDEISLAPLDEVPARKPAPASKPAAKPMAPATSLADEMVLAPLDDAPARPTKAATTAAPQPSPKNEAAHDDEMRLAPLAADAAPKAQGSSSTPRKPAPQPAAKPSAPTTSSPDEMVLAPLDDAPARQANAVTTAAPTPAPKNEAAHDDEMMLAPLAADTGPKTKGSSSPPLKPVSKPAEQPLAKTSAVAAPPSAAKKEAAHDEMTLAPLATDTVQKTQGSSSPPRNPAPMPATTGQAAKPSRPAAARPQSKPATKPQVQSKKQPASHDKTGKSALGSSSAVLFGDELSDMSDMADMNLADLSAVPAVTDATDPLGPSPAAQPSAVQRKSGHPGKAKAGKTQGAGKKIGAQHDRKVKGPSRFKSPRLWRAIAALAALGLGAYGAVWYSRLPSADEILAAAEREYESGALGAAAEKFNTFMRRHSSHPRADVARAHRALARLRAAADAGGNWPTALSTAQASVPSAADVLGHPDDRRLLADALAKIAKGLLDEAHVLAAEKTDAAQVAFDRAREAVALCRRWLPQRLRTATGLDQTELDLARSERERSRVLALEVAIRRIEAGEADQARRELLDEHAELAADTRLMDVLNEAAAAEHDHVVFGPFEPPVPPKANDFPSDGALFASAIGQTASANGVVPVLATGVGCAYGIEAASGRLLWRRFVGFDTSFVPRALDETADADLLFVDSTRSEVTRIKALSGQTVWRTPLPAFDAEPIVAADRVFVACRNGDLVALDVASGAARWKCAIPRPLSVGPAIDVARGLIYQLADEGQLYVLSESERKCIQVIYLGHESGEIATPPVIVDQWLLVAGDAGLARAMLRVLATANQPTGVTVMQTLALSGQVASPLLVHERIVYIATVGNGLESFRLGEDPTSPLVPGPRRRPDEGSPIVGRLSLAGGKLWLAGDGVRGYTLPLDESSLAAAATVAAGQFVQPIVARGESMLLAAQLAGDYGIRVQSLPLASVNSVTWTVDVGTGPAAGPAIDPTSTTVSILHQSGTLFRTPIDQFSDVAQFVSIPRIGVGAPELSQVPRLRADERSIVVFDDGLIVCSTAREPEALLVLNPTEPVPRLERWPLPGRLACHPARFGNELLLGLERGGVYLVDPRSRELVGEPFGGTFELDNLPQWNLATTPDTTQAIVSDGMTLYRLVRGATPSPALVVEAKADLDSPIKSPLAVTSTQIGVADAAGRLILFDLASLKTNAIALEGTVVWGPLALNNQLLVATEGGRLCCIAEADKIAWQVELPDGSPLSAAEDGNALIFANRRGVIWAVAATTGDTLWRREIGQPLAGAIVVAKQGVIVSTSDGTLHLLPRGVAEAK